MAITKEKKQEILTKLDGIKKDSDSIVFVNFKGLGVENTTTMRAKLREEGVGYFVAKKTLIARAFDGAFEGDVPELEGEIALAYSMPARDSHAGSDAIAPAQNIKIFVKEYADNFAIAGGIFQGVYKNKEEMTEIASIPALLVLRGMFVNIINSPIQGFAVVLNQIAEKKTA